MSWRNHNKSNNDLSEEENQDEDKMRSTLRRCRVFQPRRICSDGGPLFPVVKDWAAEMAFEWKIGTSRNSSSQGMAESVNAYIRRKIRLNDKGHSQLYTVPLLQTVESWNHVKHPGRPFSPTRLMFG